MSAELYLLFILTVASSITGNIRNILVVKGGGFAKYLIVLIDTGIFAYTIKIISDTDSGEALIVMVLAKLIGLGLTDLLVNWLLVKYYRITLYVGQGKVEDVANFLTERDISFTIFEGNFNGKGRACFSIHVGSKQKNMLIKGLRDLGIENPTMDMVEATVYGKINERTL